MTYCHSLLTWNVVISSSSGNNRKVFTLLFTLQNLQLLWKENFSMLLFHLTQLLILILEGVVLVSCYFYAIMWLRCEFCKGQMKAQIIFKVMHTAETTVCLSSYWSCHSPLLPPPLSTSVVFIFDKGSGFTQGTEKKKNRTRGNWRLLGGQLPPQNLFDLSPKPSHVAHCTQKAEVRCAWSPSILC